MRSRRAKSPLGLFGRGVFLHALAAHEGRSAQEAIATLREGAGLACSTPSLRFLDGLPGFAFLVQQLFPRRKPAGLGPFCNTVDAFVENVTHAHISAWHHDLGGGLAGLVLHAASRLPRERSRRVIAHCVTELARRAEWDARGARWKSAPEHILGRAQKRAPGGHHDLGVAHGQGGVLLALATACSVGIETEVARPLLNAGVMWLLQQRGPKPLQRMPARLGDSLKHGAPLGWCYGTPGLASVLHTVGVLVDEAKWRRTAATWMQASIRVEDAARVESFGLCHGSAGLAHLLGRMAQRSGSEALRDGALAFLDVTLDALEHTPSAKVRPPALGGMLNGLEGVGLVLLAAVSPEPTAWEGMLGLRNAHAV